MVETGNSPAVDPLRGKKLLIVEDDPFLHSLLADKLETLKGRGVVLLSALSSGEALKLVHEKHPDIILLDLVLPGISGFELLGMLRKEKEFKDTPVVVLSNLSQDSDKERAEELGVIAYFVKSDFPLGTIVEYVTKILEKSPSTGVAE